MNWVFFLVLWAFGAAFFWRLDSIGERISGRVCDRLDSIENELKNISSNLAQFDSELRNIKSDISDIHDEFKWYKKDSSAERVLGVLTSIDATIATIEVMHT